MKPHYNEGQINFKLISFITRSERVGGGAGVGSGDTESKREGG